MRVQLKLSYANACLWNISIILRLLGGWIAGPRFACCNEIRELIFRFPLVLIIIKSSFVIFKFLFMGDAGAATQLVSPACMAKRHLLSMQR